MFGRKKDLVKIWDRPPVFHVRHMGCTQTFLATGTGCSYVPVQRLWDTAPSHRDMRKVAIHISPKGLSLRDVSEKLTSPTPTPQQQQQRQQQQQQQEQQHPYHYPNDKQLSISQDFAIENISFCNVDRAVNERIFSWIYRHVSDTRRPSNRLDCHAVLCSTAQKAQTMAIVLSRAFQIAYKDWRTHHRSSNLSITRFPSSSAPSAGNSPGLAREKKNNGSVTAPSSMPTVTSKTKSSVTSSEEISGESDRRMTVSAEAVTSASPLPPCTQTPPPPPPHSGLHVSDDLTAADVDEYAVPIDVRSSVSVQQAATSSYFVSTSYILWDPELRQLMGDEDCLHADVDLEEEEEEEEESGSD